MSALNVSVGQVGDRIAHEAGRLRPAARLHRCVGLLKTRHGLWFLTAAYAHLVFCVMLGLCLHFALPSGYRCSRLSKVGLTFLAPALSFFVLPVTYWLVMVATLPGGAVRGGLSFVGVFMLHALTHHFVRHEWQCGAYSSWAVSLVLMAKFMDHSDTMHVIKGTGVSFGQAFVGVALRPAERHWLPLLLFGLVSGFSLGLYYKDRKERETSYLVSMAVLKGVANTALSDQFPNA